MQRCRIEPHGARTALRQQIRCFVASGCSVGDLRMERTLLLERASALGSTPKPDCDDGHGERRTDLKPRGHVEQLQKNGAAEHGQDGPKLRRARHHTPLPPPANVRTIEVVVEQPLLERGPAFTRRPSGQDQEWDCRQHRDRDADDTDDECGKRSGTPKQVPRLSQHAWILSGKGHQHPAVIVIAAGSAHGSCQALKAVAPQQRYVMRCEPDARQRAKHGDAAIRRWHPAQHKTQAGATT